MNKLLKSQQRIVEKRSALSRRRATTKVRQRSGDVLLIIDVINDLAFPGGQDVLPWATKLSTRLAKFARQARRARMPVIYVNDNFGMWRSDFSEVYAHCTRRSAPGREVGRRLKPRASDFFVLKPRHSGFHATALLPLLEHLGAERLLLAGIATNLCVLFTAHDAHMHGFPLIALSDCCAAESNFDHDVALGQLARFCAARVCLSTEYRFRPEVRLARDRNGKLC